MFASETKTAIFGYRCDVVEGPGADLQSVYRISEWASLADGGQHVFVEDIEGDPILAAAGIKSRCDYDNEAESGNDIDTLSAESRAAIQDICRSPTFSSSPHH